MSLGLVALGAGLAVGLGGMSAIGEGLIISHAIDSMSRNPEMQPKLQSMMIIGVALDESTAIYALVVAILILFVIGARATA